MKKSISSLFLLSLTLTSLVHGWGNNGNPQLLTTEPKAVGVNNPAVHLHGDDENGYLKLSYLLFRPHLDNASFTTKIVDAFNMTPAADKVVSKSPHFDWSSGVRLNLGRYLPHHDQWDIGFVTTFLYSDASNSLSVPNTPTTVTETFLTPQLFQGALGDYATKASGHWRMNFFTYDLGLAREYFLTPQITARPYLGVRGLTVYQDYLVKYNSFFIQNTLNPPVISNANTRCTQSQEMWGIGLKAASDVVFQLPAHFSFFGNVGGSLLYGHFKSRQKVSNGRIHPNLTPYNPIVIDRGYDLQTGLEGSIGFQWERWYPKSSNRVTLSFAFEAQQWFDMNKWARTNTSTLTLLAPINGQTALPIPRPTHVHGDLTFMGFTFALQWDF